MHADDFGKVVEKFRIVLFADQSTGQLCSGSFATQFGRQAGISQQSCAIDTGAKGDVTQNTILGQLTGKHLISFIGVARGRTVNGQSMSIAYRKRGYCHGTQHGNCQQCGQQLFDYFLHHDLRKSPFKFF